MAGLLDPAARRASGARRLKVKYTRACARTHTRKTGDTWGNKDENLSQRISTSGVNGAAWLEASATALAELHGILSEERLRSSWVGIWIV